jgi:glycosyltransferase involved in cell wall biosynthesis
MGGAEVFTYENAKRWVKAGHEVTMLTSEFPGCKREEVVDGVKIVRTGRKYTVFWSGRKYYRKYLSKDDYDVVIDEINTRPFLTIKFTDNGEKIIALIHQLAREYWFYETPFPISYIGYYFLEKKWLKNYVDVPTITVSQSTRQDLMDLGFKEVFIVPEGLNFKPLGKVPEKEPSPVVAYVGRLKKAKRPDHAIEAFKLVKKKVPEVKLWIVGDGYFKSDLEEVGTGGVKFFGGLSDGKRRELVKRAWVLVHPSVREGFGLNVVEANALGTPCVAYDVAGLRDSVENEGTGLLAEAGNIEELAENIIILLKDSTLREKLSRNALDYSKGFSWDNSAEECLKILDLVMNNS